MRSPRRILCVDGNDDFRAQQAALLAGAGYKVETAGDGALALAASGAGFDVALVDVRLPDGDGTALAAELLERVPTAQVILTTGFATLESAIAAVRAGAAAYLLKPCAPAELLLAVEQAVRQIEQLEARRELERRTQVAEKLAAVGTLTAGLSHEIKNPLNAASLQLVVLERRIRRMAEDTQAQLLGPLELVQHEILRLNALLEEFLQFAAARELKLVTVALDDLLERLLDLLATVAKGAGVALERVWQDPPRLRADEPRLEQALMNLVLNAIQATPPGGVVTVLVERDASGVAIAIEDSGSGVPDELAPRIFEPFFTTKTHGSGLGLPLVHRVVQEHGGVIDLERSRQGGARFVVHLPLELR